MQKFETQGIFNSHLPFRSFRFTRPVRNLSGTEVQFPLRRKFVYFSSSVKKRVCENTRVETRIIIGHPREWWWWLISKSVSSTVISIGSRSICRPCRVAFCVPHNENSQTTFSDTSRQNDLTTQIPIFSRLATQSDLGSRHWCSTFDLTVEASVTFGDYQRYLVSRYWSS